MKRTKIQFIESLLFTLSALSIIIPINVYVQVLGVICALLYLVLNLHLLLTFKKK